MPEQYIIPKLDPHLFKGFSKTGNLHEHTVRQTPNLPIIEDIYKGTDKGLKGGIYRKLKGYKFDRKGFPDADILNKLDLVKMDMASDLMGFSSKGMILPMFGFLITPRKWKLNLINKILRTKIRKWTYTLRVDLTDCNYLCFFEDKSLYCNLGREMLKFLTIFLTEIGIEEQISKDFAETVTLFLENDDFYRLFVEDIFTETNVNDICKPKELRRLGKIVGQRDINNLMGAKMQSMVNVVSFGLYLPSVRKAFKKALKEIDFTQFQMDEADRYFSLTWKNYNFLGQSFKQRIAKFQELHEGTPPPIVQLKND